MLVEIPFLIFTELIKTKAICFDVSGTTGFKVSSSASSAIKVLKLKQAY